MTEYTIERVNQLEEVLKCVPFEQEIRNKGRDSGRISDMLMFVNDQFENPLFGFWIAYGQDGGVIGYMAALLSLFPGRKYCFLLRMHAKKRKMREMFEDILIGWSREYGIKKCLIEITTARGVKIFKRKSWQIVSTSMEKSFRDVLEERTKK